MPTPKRAELGPYSVSKKMHYDQALGSYEAASLMGYHYGQPQKLVAMGRLTARTVTESAWSDEPTRFVSIYDGSECEANYQEYEAGIVARGGKTEKRPRKWLHLRSEAIRRLKAVKTPIAFDDAITLVEASKILGVHISLVPRMIAARKIVGRVPWNPRGQRSQARNWIVSRRSCLANVKATKAAEAAGKKPGRPRTKKNRDERSCQAALHATGRAIALGLLVRGRQYHQRGVARTRLP